MRWHLEIQTKDFLSDNLMKQTRRQDSISDVDPFGQNNSLLFKTFLAMMMMFLKRYEDDFILFLFTIIAQF